MYFAEAEPFALLEMWAAFSENPKREAIIYLKILFIRSVLDNV